MESDLRTIALLFKRGVCVSCGGLRALGTAVALQTTRVGVLCGGNGALSTRSGLLSAGVAVSYFSAQRCKCAIWKSLDYVWWG